MNDFKGFVGFRSLDLYHNREELRVVEKTVFPPYLKPEGATYLWLRPDIYDRFGFLGNNFGKYIYYHDTMNTNYSKSFCDTCIERAESLKKYDKIYVLLSGGIDSTTIIASCIYCGLSNKLVVLIGENQPENMDFFIPYFEKNGIKYKWFNDDVVGRTRNDVVDTSETNYCILSGEGSDQLEFGLLSYTKERYNNYKDYFKDDLIEDWVSNFPIKCETVSDVAFLSNYAIRITQYRWIHAFLMYKIPVDRQVAFFDTPEFSDWAITNYEGILKPIHCETEGPNYKKVFKEMISKTFGDYFNNYHKHCSLRDTLVRGTYNPRRFATDGKDRYVFNNEDKSFYRVVNE